MQEIIRKHAKCFFEQDSLDRLGEGEKRWIAAARRLAEDGVAGGVAAGAPPFPTPPPMRSGVWCGVVQCRLV